MSPPRERSESHSLSCTALEWEQLRDLAQREGKSISRLIRDRFEQYKRSRERDAPRGGAPATSPGERREMHDAVLRVEAVISRLVERPDDASPNLGDAVRTLFEARLDEMARTGRHEDMRVLLSPIVGPERAEHIVRRVLKRIAKSSR